MAGRDRFGGQFPGVIERARAGEPAALERIFTALAPVVEGYLRLQGALEPEDLTSEVFLGVLRNLQRFEGDEPAFRSWVFTIAHRRLLDDRRSRGRRPNLEPLENIPERPDELDVENEVDRAMSARRIEELCDTLSPDQRDVLLLRLVGDMTIDEIATTLDRTPGAVKALQRRGFRAIGRQLEREGVPQ
jgi:RNA polymerase sigma factor (sigma-70 family)